MDISPQVVATLTRLSRSLDGPETTLESAVEHLCAAVEAAIDSFCGLTVNAGTSPEVLEFTVRSEPSAGVRPAARSSLRIGSSMLTHEVPRLEIVLYASQERAFVDLAADVATLIEVSPYVIEVDRHVHNFSRPDALDGLTSPAWIDQAIGALLGAGQTRDRARATIQERADLDGGDLELAAKGVLEELVGDPTDGRADDEER